MSDVALPKDLRGRLISLWNAPVEKPKALISLVAPGRDATTELRHISDELGLQFIGVHLDQVVKPEQHMAFTQDKPRLVAVSGIDRLTPGERDAFARLIENGPRTLTVILCPVERDQAHKISRAWEALRQFEQEAASRVAVAGAVREETDAASGTARRKPG